MARVGTSTQEIQVVAEKFMLANRYNPHIAAQLEDER
jgi:hypothetical protein